MAALERHAGRLPSRGATAVKRDALMIVSTSYPLSADGSEAAGAFVADLAEVMSHRMTVRVVAPGVVEEVQHHGNVGVWRYAGGAQPLSLLSPTNPRHWAAILRVLTSMRRQVLAAGADDRVAHVLACWVLPSGWAARALFRQRGVPYSVWALGSDIWTLGRIPLVRAVLRRVARDSTHAFADGLGLATEAERITGRAFAFLPSVRARPAVVDDPVRTEPPYRLVFIGRWHPNKGIDLLLEALAGLGAEDWGRIAEVRVFGGGPLEARVHAAAGRLRDVGRPVTVGGYVDAARAAAEMRAADFVLIPSRIESIPLVFSDAMACGRPVVAMPVGDLPALVSRHQCGVVADSVDAAAYTVALRAALDEGLRRYASGVVDAARRFDLESSVVPVLCAIVAARGNAG